MANFYKPRYKSSFRTQTKVIPYKNSRLQKIYDRRGNLTFRHGYGHRQHLKLKSLKWVLLRRFMIPKLYKPQIRKKQRFKTDILNIKRIYNFYGKYNARKFKILFFKAYKKKRLNKMQSFISNLEQRADITLFRLRFLPTIYACHNFIKYNGILLNNTKIQYPYTKLNVGDIITIPKNIWFYFYFIFERKIFSRLLRTFSLYNRKKKLFKKLKLEFKTYRIHRYWKQRKWWYRKLYKTRFNTKILSSRYVKMIKSFNIKSFKLRKKKIKLSWKNYTKNSIICKEFINSNLNLTFKKFNKLNIYKYKNLKLKKKFALNYKIKQKFLEFKLKKIKLFKKLKKIKNTLNILFNIIKILKDDILFWLYIQIYWKYKKIKFNIINNSKNEKYFFFKTILKKTMLLYLKKFLYIKKISFKNWNILLQKLINNKKFLFIFLFKLKKLFKKKIYIINNKKSLNLILNKNINTTKIIKNQLIINKLNSIFLLKLKTYLYSIYFNPIKSKFKNKRIYKLLKIKSKFNWIKNVYNFNSFSVRLNYAKKNAIKKYKFIFNKKKKNILLKKWKYFNKLNIINNLKYFKFNSLKKKKLKTNYLNYNFIQNNTNKFFILKKNIFYLLNIIKFLNYQIWLKNERIKLKSLFNFMKKYITNYKNKKYTLLNINDFYNELIFLNKNWEKYNWIFVENFSDHIETFKNFINKEIKLNLSFKTLFYLFIYKTNLKYFKNRISIYKKTLKRIKQGLIYIDKIKFIYLYKRFDKYYFLNKYFYLYKKYHSSEKIKNFTIKKWIKKKKLQNLTKFKKQILKKTRWDFYKQQKQGFYKPIHWFIPHYFEFDFKTLRGGFIRKPYINEIIYSFNYSIHEIIQYYKDKGY